MIDRRELRRDIRRQTAIKRLRTSRPRCFACPERDPLCLQEHHPTGRKRDKTVVTVCSNDHLRLSALQTDHSFLIADAAASPSRDRVSRVAIGHFLLGLADMFEIVIPRLRQFGTALIGRSAVSDHSLGRKQP